MKFTASTIVSNSDMIKNYKSCRMKADSFGKIIILKNNQPDAVLFSITEYERLSGLIEYAEGRKCPNRRRICSNIELLQISSERSGLRGSGF